MKREVQQGFPRRATTANKTIDFKVITQKPSMHFPCQPANSSCQSESGPCLRIFQNAVQKDSFWTTHKVLKKITNQSPLKFRLSIDNKTSLKVKNPVRHLEYTHPSDKVLISKLPKNSFKSIRKRHKPNKEKWAKDSSRHFSKDNMQVTNKPKKRYLYQYLEVKAN